MTTHKIGVCARHGKAIHHINAVHAARGSRVTGKQSMSETLESISLIAMAIFGAGWMCVLLTQNYPMETGTLHEWLLVTHRGWYAVLDHNGNLVVNGRFESAVIDGARRSAKKRGLNVAIRGAFEN